MDPLAFEHFRRPDAFPSARDFDEHPLAVNALLFVQPNQLARFFDGARRVERQSGIGLRRNPSRHNLQNLNSKEHQEIVDDLIPQRRPLERRTFLPGDRAIHQRRIRRLRSGRQNQRRIGRRILRRILPHLLKVPRIGDDLGERFQRFELIRHGHFRAKKFGDAD